MRFSGLLLASALVAACTSTSVDDPDADGSPDAADTGDVDAGGTDAGDTGGEDAAVDTSPDAPVDTGADVPVDTGPPFSVTLTATSTTPLPEGVLTGTVNLVAEVSGTPDGDNLLGVEFYIDDLRVDTDLIPPFDLALDTTDLDDGEHTIAARTATGGGLAADDTLVRIVDNTAPVLRSLEPDDRETRFLEDAPLLVLATFDDDSFIDDVVFRANGLLVGELTEAPFVTAIDYADIYIDEDRVPANVLLQWEATDRIGQTTEGRSDLRIMRRRQFSTPTLGEIWGTAAVVGDRLFVANRNRRLHIFTLDGEPITDVELDGDVDMGLVADPDRERVLVSTTAGTVGAYDLSGSRVWSYNLGSPPGGAPVIVGDTVYVVSFVGGVHAFDVGSGLRRWTSEIPGNIFAGVAVTDDGTVYIGSQDRALYAIEEGNPQWSFPTGDEIWCTPVVAADGTIYVGSNDGWLYAIDPDGEERWSVEIEGQMWGRPVLYEGDVIVASTSRFIHRVDGETGESVWRTRTEGISSSSPLLAPDGNLYVGTTSGNVFAIEPDEGGILWSLELGGTLHATLVAAEHRLYIGSTDRRVYGLWFEPPPWDDGGGEEPPDTP